MMPARDCGKLFLGALLAFLCSMWLLQAGVTAVLTVQVRVLLLECLPGKVVEGRTQTRVLGTVARASDRRAVVEVSPRLQATCIVDRAGLTLKP